MKTPEELGLTEWRLARRKRPDPPLLPPSSAVEIFIVRHPAEDSCELIRQPDEWPYLDDSPRNISYHMDEAWVAERARFAILLLRECVELNPRKHGGVPVLRGTRFPISHVFAELSDGLSIGQLAADFELDRDMLKNLLMAISIHLDQPFAK